VSGQAGRRDLAVPHVNQTGVEILIIGLADQVDGRDDVRLSLGVDCRDQEECPGFFAIFAVDPNVEKFSIPDVFQSLFNKLVHRRHVEIEVP
jgi:hypothetical protein